MNTKSRECCSIMIYFILFDFMCAKQTSQKASSSLPSLSGPSSSFSSLENTIKTTSTSSCTLAKGRQSWTDASSSSAAEVAGPSIAFAVQCHSPTPSEANSHQALENSSAASESGFLNSLSSDDTSSLNSNLDHLTVPDKPTGSKAMDRGKPRNCLLIFRKRIFGCGCGTLMLICKEHV